MSAATAALTRWDALGWRAKRTKTGGELPDGSGYGPVIPLAILMALACYAFLFFYVRPHIFHGNSDFACFYRAGMMLTLGETTNIYNLDVETRYDRKWAGEYAVPGRDFPSYPFVSPPFFLLILGALARLSYAHAWAVWCAANVGMLLGIPILLRSVLGRGKLFALALLSPPFFIPVDFALFRGQVAILLAFLFAWMFTELAKGRPWRAGCILALITLKPQLAIPMFLALLFARNWKAIAGFFAAASGLFALGIALAGWRVTLAYPQVLREFNKLPQELWGPQPQRMVNARGFLYTLLHARVSSHSLEMLTLAVTLALLLLVTVSLRRPESLNLGFALVMVVTLLTSYHAYSYDASLLLPAFFLTGSYLRGRKLRALDVGLCLVVYALFLLPAVSVSFEMLVLGTFLGMLLLASLQFASLFNASRIPGRPSPALLEEQGSMHPVRPRSVGVVNSEVRWKDGRA